MNKELIEKLNKSYIFLNSLEKYDFCEAIEEAIQAIEKQQPDITEPEEIKKVLLEKGWEKVNNNNYPFLYKYLKGITFTYYYQSNELSFDISKTESVTINYPSLSRIIKIVEGLTGQTI